MMNMDTGQKTILIFRSSPLYHCLPLFRSLREHVHPDATTRWKWVVQPEVETEVRRACEGVLSNILIYDQGRFSLHKLRAAVAEALRGESIDAAYLPLNHPRGRGYLNIVRFLHELGIRNIVTHTQDGKFERITLASFLIRRIHDRARTIAESVLGGLAILALVPLISLYCLVQFAFQKKFRRRGFHRTNNVSPGRLQS